MLTLDTEGKATRRLLGFFPFFFFQSLPGWLILRQTTNHNASENTPIGFLKVL